MKKLKIIQMKMKTNRDKGLELEIYVADKLQEVFQENPAIRPTKASSGGSHNTEIADIQSHNVFVECKNHEGKFFDKKIWKHLIDSIPLGSIKIPLYVIKSEEEIFVMLSFNDLCKLLKEKSCK